MAGATSGVPDAPTDRLGQLLDAVAYAVWLTAAFAVVSGVLALLVGGQVAPGVKYGLFVFGWLAFGYGTFKLLPSRPWKDDDERGPFETAAGEDTQFQALVQRLPPARFRPVPVVHRLPTGVRVFLASLVMLGTSLALEQLFGIGP
ncbi:DUF7555 family protein [Halobacterium noricense]|uniref:DUF7555 family protein n=1 Tax=Halobacterium noricense TaxID=223182 RepID=UPI001E4C4FF4|nr:hypothetical protein [Halobacterium noricense]UHH25192.1 hypothetical protein LT974_14580 [Halobacterium noricense]